MSANSDQHADYVLQPRGFVYKPYGRRRPKLGDVVRIEAGGYPRWIDHLHAEVTSVRGKLPDAVWVGLIHKPPSIKTPRSAWRYGTGFYLPKKRLRLLQIDGGDHAAR